MSKQKKQLVKNVLGFSMVEVLVALGLTSVVSLAMMRINQNATKSQKTIEVKSEKMNFESAVRLLLSNKDACGNTLTDTPITINNAASTANLTYIRSRDLDPDPVATQIFDIYKVTGAADRAGPPPTDTIGSGSNSFIIQSMTLRNFNVATNIINLEIQLQKSAATSATSYGGDSPIVIVPIEIERDAGNVVTACSTAQDDFIEAMCLALNGEMENGVCRNMVAQLHTASNKGTAASFYNAAPWTPGYQNFAFVSQADTSVMGGLTIGNDGGAPASPIDAAAGGLGVGIDATGPGTINVAESAQIGPLASGLTVNIDTATPSNNLTTINHSTVINGDAIVNESNFRVNHNTGANTIIDGERMTMSRTSGQGRLIFRVNGDAVDIQATGTGNEGALVIQHRNVGSNSPVHLGWWDPAVNVAYQGTDNDVIIHRNAIVGLNNNINSNPAVDPYQVVNKRWVQNYVNEYIADIVANDFTPTQRQEIIDSVLARATSIPQEQFFNMAAGAMASNGRYTSFKREICQLLGGVYDSTNGQCNQINLQGDINAPNLLRNCQMSTSRWNLDGTLAGHAQFAGPNCSGGRQIVTGGCYPQCGVSSFVMHRHFPNSVGAENRFYCTFGVGRDIVAADNCYMNIQQMCCDTSNNDQYQ